MLSRWLPMARRGERFETPDARDAAPVFPEIAEFYRTVEVSHGPFFIGDLFQRKFGGPAPDYPRHFVSFYRSDAGAFLPVNYVHALPYGPVMLIGGCVTDGDAVRAMSEEHRERVMAAGGCFYIGLRSVFAMMADDCEAFFGCVDDERAYEVDIQAGFRDTPYEKLIAHFHKPLSAARKRALTDAVHEIGDF